VLPTRFKLNWPILVPFGTRNIASQRTVPDHLRRPASELSYRPRALVARAHQLRAGREHSSGYSGSTFVPPVPGNLLKCGTLARGWALIAPWNNTERPMATAEQRLVEWLRDAHAAEEQAETMLNGMA